MRPPFARQTLSMIGAPIGYEARASLNRTTAFWSSRSHTTELAIAVQRNQSLNVNASVENARWRNGT